MKIDGAEMVDSSVGRARGGDSQRAVMAGQGRATATLQRYQDLADGSPQVRQLRQVADLASGTAPLPIARRNQTGLPDRLKSGIESLCGFSMDHVRVHYNSGKPAQLQAHAYAQGSEIHLAPGQERHLPHEAWHVVQQAQGRVAPTMRRQGGVSLNGDSALENEATTMGARALAAPAQDERESDEPNPRLPLPYAHAMQRASIVQLNGKKRKGVPQADSSDESESEVSDADDMETDDSDGEPNRRVTRAFAALHNAKLRKALPVAASSSSFGQNEDTSSDDDDDDESEQSASESDEDEAMSEQSSAVRSSRKVVAKTTLTRRGGRPTHASSSSTGRRVGRKRDDSSDDESDTPVAASAAVRSPQGAGFRLQQPRQIRVRYASTKARFVRSERAKRHTARVYSGYNYATAKVTLRTKQGRKRHLYITRGSQDGTTHSEGVIMLAIAELRKQHVLSVDWVYTEREACGPDNQNCRGHKKLGNASVFGPNVKIYYTVDWPDSLERESAKDERDAGTKLVRRIDTQVGRKKVDKIHSYPTAELSGVEYQMKDDNIDTSDDERHDEQDILRDGYEGARRDYKEIGSSSE